MGLLAPWQSIAAAGLFGKGMAPPSAHLARALLMHFVTVPDNLRSALGHLLEQPSKGISLGTLHLA